ncbi:MAG: dihydroorotase [Chthonomonas sp.]|nr:dihydroorotase [Chthonomonas sp.]
MIHEAEIISATGRQVADIGIEGGQIAEIGTIYNKRRDEINAGGMVAMPGIIDTQVHFREPGMMHKEDLESGTRCAVMGGVTTIFEMPNTNPTTTTAAALDDKLQRAEGRAWCDYGFFVGAATDNIDQLAALEMLPGTPGVKIFAGSSTGNLLIEDDEHLLRVLANGKRPCPIHSEDEPRLRARKAQYAAGAHVREHPNIRDAEAARLCTERVIAACRETGRPVHVLHISTQDELPMLAAAKAEGLPVTCEATPQHLTLNAELYETLGTLLQMNPPIRDESHRAAIFEAFENDLFDVLGSDHAPHTLEEKAKPYPESPSGMPGVQTLLPVMLSWAQRGRLSLEKLVRMGCERPAELYGIVNKGHIKQGYDADLVLLDPRREFKVESHWLQSKCGWSPYEGWTLVGQPQHVFVRGTRVVKDARPERMGQGRAVTYSWK